MEKRGRGRPKGPEYEKYSIRIEKNLMEWLRKRAEDDRRSINQTIEILLKEKKDEEEKNVR